MTRTLLDLSAVAELEPVSRVLRTLSSVSDQCLVVGATARDLILHHVHEMAIMRRTMDVDIAVGLPSWNAFARVEKELTVRGAMRDPKSEHRFTVHGWRVDVIPFGGLEQGGRIVWPKTDMAMTVLGFEEAALHAAEVILPGGVRVLVAEPPALLILKLIAWKERHRERPKHDAVDIKMLLDSYAASWNRERLYDEADDLLQHFGYDNVLAGAALIGRDAVAIAKTATRDAVLDILKTETSDDATVLASDMGNGVEQNLELLEALAYGFGAL